MKKTFTLIEMLIVIVIIGILAAALVPRLQSVQARARDTERKVDLRNINSAVEMYKVDNTVYPIPVAQFIYSTQGASRFTGLLTYLTTLPLDPKNVGGSLFSTGAYNYQYGNAGNSLNSYNLSSKLENTLDPDRCEIRKHIMSNGGGGSWCDPSMITTYTPEVKYIIEVSARTR